METGWSRGVLPVRSEQFELWDHVEAPPPQADDSSIPCQAWADLSLLCKSLLQRTACSRSFIS